MSDTDPVAFGPYRLDRRLRRLSRGGAPVPLGNRALDTLAALLDGQGETVSKEALLAAVWPGLVVEENNLQVQISALRKALGDAWIITVPGRGYRLTVPATVTAEDAPPPPAHLPSLAVLPFANLSDDPEQGYFADGMVEDITTALSRIGGLFVIARNSAFTYKGRAIDVQGIGRELGVGYVVEGSVRKAANRVRITAQLIEAATATHVWADRFDGALDDIFDLQDRVTTAIAAAIEPSLRNAEIVRATAKPTADLNAYDLYLRAFAQYDLFTRASIDDGAALLRRAIALDPGFALGKALLALLISFRVSYGWTQRGGDEAQEAVLLARSALAGSRDNPSVLRFAGLAVAYVGLEIAAGRAALDRALAINPNSAGVLNYSGWIHLYLGNWQAAYDDFERAKRINPLDPERRTTLVGQVVAAAETGRFDDAIAFGREALAIGKGRPFGRAALIYALVAAGRIAEARGEAALAKSAGARWVRDEEAETLACYPASFRERRLRAYEIAGLFDTH